MLNYEKFNIKEFKERTEKIKGLWGVDLRNLLASEADFTQIKKIFLIG